MISPIERITLTPREELIQEIMLVLDDAITSDEPVSVHDLAERVVTQTEPTDDDLDRLRMFMTGIVFPHLENAGYMAPKQYDEEYGADAGWTYEIVRDLLQEIGRGPIGWRNDIGGQRT